MNGEITIFCDASLRKMDNGVSYYCSGAICENTQKTLYETGIGTNNVGELKAVYLAAKLAVETSMIYPNKNITIYSDSIFAVKGLTTWMKKWYYGMDNNGILYGYNGEPVKNQELFKLIIGYLVSNNVRVKIRHCKGHIDINSPKKLALAGRVFYESNGYNISQEDIKTICFYNNIVDNTTRDRLQNINPDEYKSTHDLCHLVYNVIPRNYRSFIS